MKPQDPRLDLLVAGAFVAVAAGAHYALHGSPDLATSAWLASVAFTFARATEKHDPWRRAGIVGSSVVFSFLAKWAHALVIAGRPMIEDARLFGLERRLRFEPSFSLGRAFERAPVLAGLCGLCYLTLPLAGAIVYALDRPRDFGWIKKAWLAGILAVPCYIAVPAVGPLHAFPGYPAEGSEPFATSPFRAPDDSPRNCVPSLHLTWALLIALNARGRRARPLAAVYATLVALATLGFGEHYFLDLVLAVPFSIAIQRADRPAVWIPSASVFVATLMLTATDRIAWLSNWPALAAIVTIPVILLIGETLCEKSLGSWIARKVYRSEYFTLL